MNSHNFGLEIFLYTYLRFGCVLFLLPLFVSILDFAVQTVKSVRTANVEIVAAAAMLVKERPFAMGNIISYVQLATSNVPVSSLACLLISRMAF